MFRLQKETPSDNDLFEGESHKNVANRMSKIISAQEDISIVGLEGDLGSGKSTIIKFVEKELSENYKFISFDAEKYHYGTTKKALIEVIYTAIKSVKGVNDALLEKHKDIALGNIVEYNKKVNSRISWWTVLFILLSLLSAQTVRYLFIGIDDLIKETGKTAIFTLIIELVTVLSPAILLIIIGTLHKFLENRVPSVGDLFQKNSTDTIHEKWVVSKEVGTIELTEALSGFTSSAVLKNKQKFILVIDNLDRVGPEKVKELWSDMELICGAANGGFKIIVPYSEKHVSAALDVDGISGKEFISKRIPINFSVPALISAGWQDAFINIWNETVSADTDDAKSAIRLIEIWRPVANIQITPRMLKKLANDVHILALTTPKSEHKHVLIVLYILFVRASNGDVRMLISQQLDNSIENVQHRDKIVTTQSLLGRIFNGNIDTWTEYLISIHYQSEITLARSELIDEPLLVAVFEKDALKIDSLSSLWGFGSAWRRCFDKFDIYNWCAVLSKLHDNSISLMSTEIKTTTSYLNNNYPKDEALEINTDFYEAAMSLYERNIFGSEPFYKKRYNQLKGSFITHNIDDYPDISGIKNILHELNGYSNVLQEKPFLHIEINGRLYIEILVPLIEDSPFLDIPSIELSPKNLTAALSFICQHVQSVDIFDYNVMKHYGAGNNSITEVIKANKKKISAELDNVYNDFVGSADIADMKYFRVLTFHPTWVDSDMSVYYRNKLASLDGNEEEFNASLIANMISCGDFKGVDVLIKEYDEDIFNNSLYNYLCWQSDLAQIVDALSEDIKDIITPAVARLIDQQSIGALDYNAFIQNHYNVLENIAPSSELLSLLDEDALIDTIDKIDIDTISINYLRALYSDGNYEKTCRHIFSLTEEITRDINIFIQKSKPNTSLILEQAASEKYNHKFSIDIDVFCDFFKNIQLTQLNKAGKLLLLYRVLSEDDKLLVKAKLSDLLYERGVEVERRIAMIHSFGSELTYNEPSHGESRRPIASMFEKCDGDSQLADWLDAQDLHFSKWPSEDEHTAITYILKNQSRFPTICERSVYIRNRIKEIEENKKEMVETPEIQKVEKSE